MSFKVYRFTFTPEITSQLYEFNRIHQYSDKTTYKEAWEKWREENNHLIDKEIERLKELGYNGMEILYKVKTALDPDNIMNPGKVFDIKTKERVEKKGNRRGRCSWRITRIN